MCKESVSECITTEECIAKVSVQRRSTSKVLVQRWECKGALYFDGEGRWRSIWNLRAKERSILKDSATAEKHSFSKVNPSERSISKMRWVNVKSSECSHSKVSAKKDLVSGLSIKVKHPMYFKVKVYCILLSVCSKLNVYFIVLSVLFAVRWG